MRQNPVGEPAATAALNFATPRRRSSLKRLGPFCHCRQRYERNLRRIQDQITVMNSSLHEAEAYRAMFAFALPLRDLDEAKACNIPAAIENAEVFAAEVMH